jgi:arylsulfatase A-like enzyme
MVVTLRPFDAWGAPLGSAQHGQPSDLDTHVPLILWGRGILAGTYDQRVNTVDIAPTLARLLGLSPFSLLDGRVLKEALEPPR